MQLILPGAYAGRLSVVFVTSANPRRIDAPMESFGISESAAKVRLHRARQKLRVHLFGDGDVSVDGSVEMSVDVSVKASVENASTQITEALAAVVA